ncbi:MAG: hypothetical protein IPK79_00690 [Vampirovibrionales bacterium]|nr:hypothetical protein [Vampirovibrionales bacterium]
MIKELMEQGSTREQVVQVLIDNKFALGEVDAEFIIGIELGEIDGDVIVVDDYGNEVRRHADEDEDKSDGKVE